MKKFVAVMLVLTMMLSLAACAKPAPTPGTSGEESKFKDTIVFAPNTDAASLDPHVQNDTTSEQVVKMLYNTLLKFDENRDIVGDLAESWEVSEDQRTWNFKLKEGVKFHNGTEMTAESVKGTYERAMDPANGLVVGEIVKMFEKVEVVDKYTVSITTTEPYGAMMALLCNLSLAVMDPAYIEKYGMDLGSNVESINGTGPYKVATWTRDEELVLERYDDYFGDKALTKSIVYRPIPEAAARVIALETGEVDAIQGVPADEVERLEKTEGLSILKAQSVGQRVFRFGCDDSIISNTKVRQALVYAVDRQTIIDSLFPGLSYASTAPLAPVTWGYANFGEIKQDKEKAKQLLTEAGYPNGFKTKIVTTDRYAKGVELAEIIASQLKEVGVEAEIQVMEWSAFLQTIDGITAEEFDAPIFIMGAGPSMMDADGGLRGLYTTTLTGKNDRNYGFYSNKEVDELVDAGMKETDPDKRKELYKRAQEILFLEDPAGIWLFDQLTNLAHSSKLKDVKVSPIGTITFEKATIEK
ncbi:MAG: ABC transporter substrate-binding protein [Bacteroidales bacterium]|nr:ABC transporter substrate-binding protein [Bacteroidales bacterium]